MGNQLELVENIYFSIISYFLLNYNVCYLREHSNGKEVMKKNFNAVTARAEGARHPLNQDGWRLVLRDLQWPQRLAAYDRPQLPGQDGVFRRAVQTKQNAYKNTQRLMKLASLLKVCQGESVGGVVLDTVTMRALQVGDISASRTACNKFILGHGGLENLQAGTQGCPGAQ